MSDKQTLKTFARELRTHSTYGEIILWNNLLKGRKVYGYQFLRQFPIDKFIVDFACRKLKLIIEIDGYSHNFKYKKDELRDNKLKELGFSVLRFTENEVRTNIENIKRTIELYIENNT